MHKLLPFRQYDEKDVLNMFKLNLGNTTLSSLKPGGTASGGFTGKEHWSGTPVMIDANNDWNADDPTNSQNAYLGAIGSANQGSFALKEGSIYPEAPSKVGIAVAGTVNTFGITLKPTLAFDENDEKLLYYSQKKDELQCVLPGEASPIATRGFFTLSLDAFVNQDGATAAVPGNGLLTAALGTFTGASAANTALNVGLVLATGSRTGARAAANDSVFVQFLGHNK